jgi:hypothetical protein
LNLNPATAEFADAPHGTFLRATHDTGGKQTTENRHRVGPNNHSTLPALQIIEIVKGFNNSMLLTRESVGDTGDGETTRVVKLATL